MDLNLIILFGCNGCIVVNGMWDGVDIQVIVELNGWIVIGYLINVLCNLC